MRYDFAMTDREQVLIELEPVGVNLFLQAIPIQLGLQISALGIGIGNGLAHLGGVEFCEAGELASSSVCDRSGQVSVEISEEKEWGGSAKLFAHEYQWRRRREEQYLHGCLQGARIGELGDSFAESTISDLIVVLHERNEGRRRQVAAGFAAVFAVILRVVTLIGEPFQQAAAKVAHRIRG